MKQFLHSNGSISLLLLTTLLLSTGCLKDDFSKLIDSEWNPDLAFPLVNSTLTAADILANDESPTVISSDNNGIVEIIYSSTDVSPTAAELITLPVVQVNSSFGPSATNTSAFNANLTPGTQLSDSVSFSFPYSLDAQLGSTSRLDTVVLKSGKLLLNISSLIPHACAITIEIPELIINNQIYRQVIPLNFTSQTPITVQLERNLAGAYLIPGASAESLTITYKIALERINAQPIPAGDPFSAQLSFENTVFEKLSGYFGNYSAPLIDDDTLFLRIFKNVITAQNLYFTNPTARIVISNSTGIPINYTQTAFGAFRPGVSIPSVDLSGFTYPTNIPGQGHIAPLPASYEYAFTSGSGSNISEVINFFPRYMLSRGNYAFNASPVGTGYFLRDTSRVRLYSEVTLPLNGLTLDLQVRDTFEFQVKSVSGDVEEMMLRLNITNGFPTDGLLQVYFGKQLSGPGNPIQIIDSLYIAGTEPVLLPGQTGTNGTVTVPTQKITDAIISRAKWLKLSQYESDRILIKAKLTTYDLGQLAVKILEKDELQIRIAARIKVKKTF